MTAHKTHPLLLLLGLIQPLVESATPYPPYEYCVGSMNITADNGLTSLERCTKIKGAVRIAGIQAGQVSIQNMAHIQPQNEGWPFALELAHNLKTTDISLLDLEQVDGWIAVYDNTALKQLSMPKLKRVSNGGILITANQHVPQLAGDSPSAAAAVTLGSSPLQNVRVDLTSLEKVKGNMSLANIDSLSLGNLTSIEQGDFNLIQSQLQNLELPSLSQVVTLTIRDNPRLKSIQLRTLESISGNLMLAGNPSFAGFSALDAPKLARIRGSVVIEETNVVASIRSLDFGSSLKSIDGGLFVRIKVAQQDGNMTCTKLHQVFKKSGIVRGKFVCEFQDQDGKSIDSSESRGSTVTVDIFWMWMLGASGLLMTLL